MATSGDYETPPLPTLLTVSSFLYLINVADVALARTINAGLIGPLLIGIIFGPQAADILPQNVQQPSSLLFNNIMLSVVVALTGVLLPIALSLLLLHFGYRYSVLRAFGAGAALCSTSLGTTLALLRPELRQTQAGAVLMSAALLDDIGVVMQPLSPIFLLQAAARRFRGK
ncbi:hypothetical protein BD779DRAFT_1677021 [Infundibulicybe gibba]|nr:hypothetical protein BD779DRAFT_1677021 [Infundibulicybe gibba]